MHKTSAHTHPIRAGFMSKMFFILLMISKFFTTNVNDPIILFANENVSDLTKDASDIEHRQEKN